MKRLILAAAMTAIAPATMRAQIKDPDPAKVNLVDAIECRLDAPTYNGFAFGLDGEEQIARKRKWVMVPSKNPMITEYKLPAPITVAGHYTTRRIALTSSGILAVLDLADPAPLAREQGIKNAADAGALLDALRAEGEKVPSDMPETTRRSGKFLGEKIVSDKTEKATPETRFGSHTIIARNISTVTSHPGKTLYGCSYRITVLDKNGHPL